MQLKILQRLPGGSDFLGYVDAIGELDGTRCIIDWKTTTARYADSPVGLLTLDPQLTCYSWLRNHIGRKAQRVWPFGGDRLSARQERATLIGWTSLWIDGRLRAEPEINSRRGVFVLGKSTRSCPGKRRKNRSATSALSSLGNISAKCAPSNIGNSKS